MQMVWLSATRRSCIAILWVSLVNCATIILCIASQRVFIVVSVYFLINSVRKLLDTHSYIYLPHWRTPWSIDSYFHTYDLRLSMLCTQAECSHNAEHVNNTKCRPCWRNMNVFPCSMIRLCITIENTNTFCHRGMTTVSCSPTFEGRIILERMLGKLYGRMWTGCIWLRVETNGGPLWTR
jgi:hypothetical protein